MTPEAERILEVYRTQGLRTGAMIHPAEFGHAIVWEDGFVRDEPIQEALGQLFQDGFLIEHSAAFELTPLGDDHLYGVQQPKFGARVYLMGERILVKQTLLRGNPAEYVIDNHRERHIDVDDDTSLAQAIRDAVKGKM